VLVGPAVFALSDHFGSSRCVQRRVSRANATYVIIARFPEFPVQNRDLHLGAAIPQINQCSAERARLCDHHAVSVEVFSWPPAPLSQRGSAAKSLSSFYELAKVRDCIERSNSADAGLGFARTSTCLRSGHLNSNWSLTQQEVRPPHIPSCPGGRSV